MQNSTLGLHNIDSDTHVPAREEIALEAKSITIEFDRNKVLSGLDMAVPRGAVYGLIGRNGAGKTTLMQAALGLIPATAGTIRALGLDPIKNGIELRERVGYIPERLALYDWMTVAEVLRFVAAQYKRWSTDESQRLVARFELDKSKRVRQLSRGNLALLALVIAMSHDPELVLLDECTSGMDAIFRSEFDRSVIDALHGANRTVVFASHQIRELEFLCDWIGILHGGRLIVQMPAESLKASVKSVLIKSADELAPLVNELRREKFGHDWLVTVDRFTSVSDFSTPPGIVVQEVVDLTLEQIFVAVVTSIEGRS